MPPVPRQLRLAALPPQAEVDRGLSIYEAWVHVDIALPTGPGETGEGIYIEERGEVAR